MLWKERSGIGLPFAALGLALGLGAPFAAQAQNVNSGVSIGPSQELSQPLTPGTPAVNAAEANNGAAPNVEQLLAGLPVFDKARVTLGNLGISILGDVTTEFAGNVSGSKQGSTFATQLGLELDVDWEKLARIRGLSTHVVVVNRSGSSASRIFGDNLIPVQEIYGAGGDVAVHFVYAYAEEKLLNDHLDIALGRFPVNNDFAASPYYCNFMTNALCGNPKPLPGGNIAFSSYPEGVWAARARFRPTDATYIQFGIYEVNQDLYQYDNFRSGFKFDTSKDSGEYFPVEAAYLPLLGADKMPGHYKIGFGYDNSSYNDFYVGDNGAPFALTGQSPKVHKGHTAAWALADQMVVRNGPGESDGLVLLGGFSRNDPTTSAFDYQLFAGMLDRAFWKARPLDTIGILYSYNTISSYLTRAEELDFQLGLPTPNGSTGPQTHEHTLEVNYDIHVYRGVNFQPEFEYIFRPNAQGNLKDAAVFGFKSHVAF